MSDKDKFRDFSWWLRLAVVIGIIWFGISLHLSIGGILDFFGILPTIVRSMGGSLAAAGVVAAVGLFVSRSPTAEEQDEGNE